MTALPHTEMRNNLRQLSLVQGLKVLDAIQTTAHVSAFLRLLEVPLVGV